MRGYIRNNMVALSKGALKVPAAALPPAPSARPNRRQRRQQELGQRRTEAQVNRSIERALTTPKKAVTGIDKGIGSDETVVVTKDGDQYTLRKHEPTESVPKT